MNLTPIANNTLTQQAAAPVDLLTGAASSGAGNGSNLLGALGSSSTNPMTALATLGSAPTQGVAATRNFQQTLASALAEILSKINISAGMGDDSSSDNSSSIVPDFTKTMMPLQLSLAMNSMQNLSTAARLPSSNNQTGTQTGGGTTPGSTS